MVPLEERHDIEVIVIGVLDPDTSVAPVMLLPVKEEVRTAQAVYGWPFDELKRDEESTASVPSSVPVADGVMNTDDVGEVVLRK